MSTTEIELRQVHKYFHLDNTRNATLWTRVYESISRKNNPGNKIHVINDFSLSVSRGETIGIIGLNGSGKSTLLRLIAGIYAPDSGSVECKRRATLLMGVGRGLSPRLSMRENIYLSGALYGMSREYMRQQFDSIVEFSELKDFVDTRIYQFSSGMLQRLGFAIVIHLQSEVLILDEVLSAGDASFKQKASDKFNEMINSGKTAIFASHALPTLNSTCDRVCWLHKGRQLKIGLPEDVTGLYEEFCSMRKTGMLEEDIFKKLDVQY